MKRRVLLIVGLIALALSAAACGRTAAPQLLERDTFLSGSTVEEGSFDVAMEAPAAEPVTAEMAFASDTIALPPAATQSRLIIRTADMTVIVADTEEAMKQIAAMAENNGGWVVSSNIFQGSGEYKSGSIAIRVPAEGFQSALDAIQSLAVRVDNLSTSGQDVTEEYVDLEARLGNLEATAERVRSFLDEATRVEDALAVNQELSRLEGEIEVIKGRMQYLDQSAAYSTISVNLQPDVSAQPVDPSQTGWRLSETARNAFDALVQTMQSLVSLVVWFVIYILPILLVLAIPLVLLLWLAQRLRRRRAERPQSPPATE